MATDVRATAAEIEQLASLLLGTQSRFRRHFEDSCAQLDLPASQASLLRLLDRPRRMRELAETMHCDAGNVTGLVDRLEERGLVTRREDMADRRRKVVTLTDRGRATRDRLIELLYAEPPGVHGLSADERRQLVALLTRLLGSA
jgi:DNA-binding MarR family transcriptional regulator